MHGNRIRFLLAIAIGAILILALAIRARAGRSEPGSASPRAEAAEANTRLVDTAELDVAGPRPDRASLAVIPSGAVEAPGDAVEAEEGTLSGMLLDPAGRPILDASWAGVALFDAHGYRRLSEATGTGRYEFRGLPFGSYSLVADARKYLKVEDTHEVEPSRLEAQRDFTLLPQPRLKIRAVTPDGQSLQQALIKISPSGMGALLIPIATREPPGERFAGIRGSLNNRFGMGSFWYENPEAEGLTDEHIGLLLLHCELPVHVSLVHYHHVLQTVTAPMGTDEVTFVLSAKDLLADLSTVRFRLEDERTGRGIPGASIFFQGAEMQMLQSGEDGTVTVEGLAPGEYKLRVDAEYHEVLEFSFEARSGITELGSLRLGDAFQVRVRVVDEAGTPRGVKLFVRTLDPETRRVVDRDGGVRFGQASVGNGVFELTRLGRRLYCLQIVPSDPPSEEAGASPNFVAENVLLDTREGPISDVEVVLRPASRLVLRTNDPDPSSWTFQIYDERDLWVRGSSLYDRMPRPIELAPGTYRVAVCDRDGKELSSRSVTVGAEPVVLELSR